MSLTQRRANVAGGIGIACIAFVWVVMLIPKSIKVLGPVLNALGPLQWLLMLAIIVLPTVAAKRGSRWWLAGTVAGAITFVDLLYHALD